VRARIRPANIRAGWYVDRSAFGADLYAHGRGTPLRTTDRSGWCAQDHLVQAWTATRPAAETLFGDDELCLVDAAVDGVRPRPLECEPDGAGTVGPFVQTAFGRAIHRRDRPHYSIEPLSIAWEAVAFRVRGVRDAVACVPRSLLADFLDELDAGHLDGTIETFLASPPRGRVLRASTQASDAGLFDEMASPDAIAPAERVMGLGVGGRGGGSPRRARRNKHRRSGRRALLLASAAFFAIAACVAGAYAVTQRDDTRRFADGGDRVGQPFDVVFTVASVNVGPHYRGEPVPAVGAQERVRVYIDCPDNTCSFGNDGASSAGPYVDLGLQFAQTSPGFYKAIRDSNEFAGACGRNIVVHQVASANVHTDPNGPVTGFTGRYEVTHPDGVEFDSPSGVCATFDIAYTFVGTPASS
jgi:hypothetical protein